MSYIKTPARRITAVSQTANTIMVTVEKDIDEEVDLAAYMNAVARAEQARVIIALTQRSTVPLPLADAITDYLQST